MFCDNCGNEINDNARFCRYCGLRFDDEKISEEQSVYAASNRVDNQAKEKELAELEQARQFIVTVWPHYKKINWLYGQLNYVLQNKKKDVLTIVWLIIGLFILFIGILQLVTSNNSSGIGVGVFFLVSGFGISVVSFVVRPNRKRRVEEMNEEECTRVENEIKNENNILLQLQKSPKIIEMAQYYGEYFPNGDMDEEAVAYIINLMKTRRCDSFKEAINLYDNHMYLKKQENIRIAMLEEQRKTTQAAQVTAQAAVATAQYSASTARASRIAALSSSICAINSFYIRKDINDINGKQ